MLSFDIPAIRSALPIEQILEPRGVKLRRGRGPCLICGTSDQSQAFSVRGDRWRCFACNEHGDVVDLVSKIDRVPLPEAIRRTAVYAGIAPGRRPASAPRSKSAWQIEREAQSRAWWAYLAVRRERETIARRYDGIARRLGADHSISTYFARVLGEAYDRELVAEYRCVAGSKEAAWES
jgi:phage/plasmid primase-like uncharacterized protein